MSPEVPSPTATQEDAEAHEMLSSCPGLEADVTTLQEVPFHRSTKPIPTEDLS